MTDSSTENAPPQSTGGENKISLLELAIVLAKRKMVLLGVPFIASIVAIVVSLSLPIVFTSTAKILPPQQSPSGASAMLAQLGNVLANGSIPIAGIRNPNDLYVGMLRSRTVADNLVQRFELMKVYESTYVSQARKQLAGNSSIVTGRDGIITIEVDDMDPKRAADLANGYVDELLKLTKVLAVTEAGQRRLFFERQLEQAKVNLNHAEAAARQALQKGGLVQVEGQGRAMVDATARLRGQITVKEVQIGAMRNFSAEGNPELRLAQQELESMRRELAKMEGTSSAKEANADEGKGIDNLSLLRNVKYSETVYELLARQYEFAKIDEARDAAVIQVIDKAIEPDRRSRPMRTRIVVMTTMVAGIFSIVLAFILEAIEKGMGDPERSRRFAQFKGYLWVKKS